MFTPKRPKVTSPPNTAGGFQHNASSAATRPMETPSSSSNIAGMMPRATAATLRTPGAALASPAPQIQILPSLLSSSTPHHPTRGSFGASHPAAAATATSPSRLSQLDTVTPRVLIRSEHLLVKSYSSWPSAVQSAYQQHFQQTPQVPSNCIMDFYSNYIALVLDSACFVWSFLKPAQTCRRFTLPQPRSPYYETSKYQHHLTFVMKGREVGLLSASSDGQIRYWDEIQFGNSDTHKDLSIHIPDGDSVECIANCDPAGIVICTKKGNLFRISIVTASSSLTINPAVLTYSTLTRPIGVLAKVGSLLGFSSTEPTTFEPICILPGQKSPDQTHSRNMYLLTERTIQCWTLSNTYPEKFVYEEDLSMLINMALQDVNGQEGFFPLDLQLIKNDVFALLVAQPIEETNADGSTGMKLLYHIILIATKEEDDPHSVTTHIRVQRVISLSHQAYLSSDGQLEESLNFKMLIPNGGPAVFVYCPQFVILLSLSPKSEVQEKKPMRRNSDQIIAAIGDISKIWSKQSETNVTAYFLCTESGILQVDMLNLKSMDPSSAADEETPSDYVQAQIFSRLKSQLEQAVFYGNQENPVTTEITITVTSILQKICVAISDEILTSKSQLFPTIIDMQLQLLEKSNKLNRLVNVLEAFNILDKLNAETRFHLLGNVEIIMSALAVWKYFNPLLSFVDGRQRVAMDSNQSAIIYQRANILIKAVREILREPAVDITEHSLVDANIVRNFFNNYLQQFPQLLAIIQRNIHMEEGHRPTSLFGDFSRSKLNMTSPQCIQLFESNRIIITAFTAAYEYRDQHNLVYGLNGNKDTFSTDSSAEIRLPWTAGNEFIDFFMREFDVTSKMWHLLSETPSGAEVQLNPLFDADNEEEQSFSEQCITLADIMFRSFIDRIQYLISTNDLEEKETSEKFSEYQPKIIKQIVSMKKVKDAFTLAERYQDFNSLIDLCYDERIVPRNEGSRKMDAYIEEYGDPFAFSLFEWYIRHDQKAVLLNPPPSISLALEQFLHGNSMDPLAGHPDISWVHDLALNKFGSAASTLIHLSTQEIFIQQRKTMASLGKLAATCASDHQLFSGKRTYCKWQRQ